MTPLAMIKTQDGLSNDHTSDTHSLGIEQHQLGQWNDRIDCIMFGKHSSWVIECK